MAIAEYGVRRLLPLHPRPPSPLFLQPHQTQCRVAAAIISTSIHGNWRAREAIVDNGDERRS